MGSPHSKPHGRAEAGPESAIRFSASEHSISTSALGQGFSFSVKQPPRPGQFSNRPGCQSLVGSSSYPVASSGESSRECQPSRGGPLVARSALPRGRPLPLHELSLAAYSTSSTSPPRRILHSSTSAQGSDQGKEEGQRQDNPSRPPPTEIPSREENRPLLVAIEPESQGGSNPLVPHSSLLDCTAVTLPKTLCLTKPSGTAAGQEARTSSPAQEDTAQSIELCEGANGACQEDDLPDMRPRGSMLPNVTHSQPSPASTCGDLERPLRHRAHRSHRSMLVHPAPTSQKVAPETPRRHRSRSLASNISRKRSVIGFHRPRPRAELDRKKAAMHQVAQYWNECIQIAEEENKEANREIDRLRGEVERQHQKLYGSRSLIEERGREIVKLRVRLQEIEAKDSLLVAENRELKEKIDLISGQVSMSRAEAGAFQDRQKKYRMKLNEAISEQQTLFARGRAFYEESINGLRREINERASSWKEVDQALTQSRQKREELKQCVEEVRTHMGREIQLSRWPSSERNSIRKLTAHPRRSKNS